MNWDLAGGETLPSAQILSQDGANRKAILKMILEDILKTKGTFFPVGPGKPCFRLKITVFRTQYSNCLRTVGGNSKGKG